MDGFVGFNRFLSSIIFFPVLSKRYFGGLSYTSIKNKPPTIFLRMEFPIFFNRSIVWHGDKNSILCGQVNCCCAFFRPSGSSSFVVNKAKVDNHLATSTKRDSILLSFRPTQLLSASVTRHPVVRRFGHMFRVQMPNLRRCFWCLGCCQKRNIWLPRLLGENSLDRKHECSGQNFGKWLLSSGTRGCTMIGYKVGPYDPYKWGYIWSLLMAWK